MKKSSKPNRNGATWTENDNLKLKELYLKGLSINDIAIKLERTDGSIRSQIIKQAPIWFSDLYNSYKIKEESLETKINNLENRIQMMEYKYSKVKRVKKKITKSPQL